MLSSPAAAIRSPSGATATAVIASRRATRRIPRPSEAPIHNAPGKLTAARRRPPAPNATRTTGPSRSRRDSPTGPPFAARTRTVPSSCPVATRSPSGLSAAASTGSRSSPNVRGAPDAPSRHTVARRSSTASRLEPARATASAGPEARSREITVRRRVSQTRTTPRASPTASRPPSRSSAATTAPRWPPANGTAGVSQIRATPVSPPVARRRPSGENATLLTGASWPRSTSIVTPPARSHTRTVRSVAADAPSSPRGSRSTSRTTARCPRSTASRRPDRASHIVTVPSEPPVSTRRPSAEIAALNTSSAANVRGARRPATSQTVAVPGTATTTATAPAASRSTSEDGPWRGGSVARREPSCVYSAAPRSSATTIRDPSALQAIEGATGARRVRITSRPFRSNRAPSGPATATRPASGQKAAASLRPGSARFEEPSHSVAVPPRPAVRTMPWRSIAAPLNAPGRASRTRRSHDRASADRTVATVSSKVRSRSASWPRASAFSGSTSISCAAFAVYARALAFSRCRTAASRCRSASRASTITIASASNDVTATAVSSRTRRRSDRLASLAVRSLSQASAASASSSWKTS